MRMFAQSIAASLLLSSVLAVSAVAAPVRIRGEITDVSGKLITIRTTSGTEAKVSLTDPLRVGAVAKATLADIGPDSYVGAAGVAQADGTIKALEIHIFPVALRGTGEGHRDFDLEPGATMTNAAVTGKVDVEGGSKLTLTYAGGVKTLIVAPRTPIVRLIPGDVADVKPGVGVIIYSADKAADGSMTASRLTVGKDGVNPPM